MLIEHPASWPEPQIQQLNKLLSVDQEEQEITDSTDSVLNETRPSTKAVSDTAMNWKHTQQQAQPLTGIETKPEQTPEPNTKFTQVFNKGTAIKGMSIL